MPGSTVLDAVFCDYYEMPRQIFGGGKPMGALVMLGTLLGLILLTLWLVWRYDPEARRRPRSGSAR